MKPGGIAVKGVVFTEFFEMVEQSFSPELAERLIEQADLPNEGAYTAVGTYDAEEMVRLVTALSGETGTPVPDLLFAFGRHLLARFAEAHEDYFTEAGSVFRLLEGIENKIHSDVRKLYPDAELPRFDCHSPSADRLVLDYSSPRGLAKLAEGLITASIEHYGEPVSLTVEASAADGTKARFVLDRPAA